MCGMLASQSGSREPCRYSIKGDNTIGTPSECYVETCGPVYLLWIWTFKDKEVQSEESMPLDCAAEICVSEKLSTVRLLTRDACGVSNIVKIEDFSKLSRLVGVVTQVLKFCSILKKNVNPGCHTTFDG